MSTFKKVISLVLCIAMLAGSFAFVGDLAIPSASAAEATSKIDSYADLVTQYGTNVGDDGLVDGFVYVGTEYYEADGTLTDYYVQPGDRLTVRLYVKSNMYCGDGILVSLYDKNFFDVKELVDGSSKNASTGYCQNFKTDKVVNKSHPMVARNAVVCTMTSQAINTIGWIKQLCGFDATFMANTDLVQCAPTTNVSVSTLPYEFTSDDWYLTYYVDVKEGLADGTVGEVLSPEVLWPTTINTTTNKHDQRRKSYMPCSEKTAYVAEGKVLITDCLTMANALDKGQCDYVIKDDMNHTFTIGEPAGETEEKTYDVTFVEADGTVIGEPAKLAMGAAVTFPAEVENQIGWAVVQNGSVSDGSLVKNADLAGVTVAGIAKFMRVLDTTKFDVVVELGAGVTVDETKLPTGVTYNAEKNALVVALAVGESFDFANIPFDALNKKDNEASAWTFAGVTAPSTVEGTVLTLGNINGEMSTVVTAKAGVEWTTATYTAKFYLDKEAYESGAEPVNVVSVVANTNLAYDIVKDGKGKADMKFAGWFRADEGTSVSSTVSVGVYKFSQDMVFYADWSKYEHSFAFMVRDYENGSGWKEYKRVYANNNENPGSLTKANINAVISEVETALDANLIFALTADIDTLALSEIANHVVATEAGATKDVAYSEHQNIYLATEIGYEVTWKVDGAEDVVDNCKTAYQTGSLDAYSALSKYKGTLAVPTGYELVCWKNEATGEAVKLDVYGNTRVSGLTARKVTLVAEFKLIEYKVAFNLRNGDYEDILKSVETYHIGDTFELGATEYTLNDTDAKTVLPAVGDDAAKEGSGYEFIPGMIFNGWTIGYQSNAVPATFPLELTEDIIKRNFVNGAIQFNGSWEAKEYTLTFYITNSNGEKELFDTHKVKAGDNLVAYKEVTTEINAAINAKAPEGKTFSKIWVNSEGVSDSMTKMPANDLDYYASYVTSTLSVYIDYNNLPEENLSVTLKRFDGSTQYPLIYGDDVAVAKEDGKPSFETYVMLYNIGVTNQPGEGYEVVKWNVYHVELGADPYKKENWKPGVSDEEGSTIAKSTIIYQPEWKAHADFFFRILDNGPQNRTVIALGKNFKLYFWDSQGKVVSSMKDVKVNTKEDFVIFFYSIEVENWNWDEFFNPDMWASITVSVKPALEVNKDFFTPEGFIKGMAGLGDVIKNLIGSLL